MLAGTNFSKPRMRHWATIKTPSAKICKIMNWLALTLLVVVIYLIGKIIQERRDREFEVDRLKWSHLLKEAGVDEQLFIYISFSEIDQQELAEAEQLHRIIHRRSGKVLLLKSGGRFFEWQESVHNGPPLYAELGGIVVSGTKCKELVEIDRARALAQLEEE